MFKSLLHHTKSNNKTKQSIFKVKENKTTFHLVSNENVQIILDHLPT